MTFLISLETPTRGSYVLGFIEVQDQESPKETRRLAQNAVVEALVAVGFSLERIGIQVTDNTTLEIGPHKIAIVPIKEFPGQMAVALATLLR